jgi:hypothetical protein
MGKSYESCKSPSSIPSRHCRNGVTGCLDPLTANVNMATKCDVTRRQRQTPDFCHQTPVLVLDLRTLRLVAAVPGRSCATDEEIESQIQKSTRSICYSRLGRKKRNSGTCKRYDPGRTLQPSTAAHIILDRYQTEAMDYGVLSNAPVRYCIIVLASFRFRIELVVRF